MQEQTEPPKAPDGGWGWTALVASLIAGTIVTGYAKGIGILLVEWQIHFDVGAKEVAWIGMAIGSIYKTAGVIASPLSVRFGSRIVVIAGGLLMSVSLLASSFVLELWHLYIASVFTGFGIALGYTTSLTVIGYYFHERLGFANGVAFSGSGLGLIAMPPLIQLILDRYSWQGTMRILAGLSLLVCLCGLLMRPTDREKFWMKKQTRQRKRSMRESISIDVADCLPDGASRKNPVSRCLHSVAKASGFHLICENTVLIYLCFAFAFAGFGAYASTVFFNARAVFDVGISPQEASYLVSTIGIGDVIGRVSHGLFLDRKWVTPTAMYVSVNIGTAGVTLMNPLAKSFVALLFCAFIFGTFNGPITSLELMILRGILPPGDVTVGFGVLLFFNGLSLMAGVFVMGFLFDATGNYNLSFIVAGTAFMISGALTMLRMFYSMRTCKTRDLEESDVSNSESKEKYPPENSSNHPSLENKTIFVVSCDLEPRDITRTPQ